MRSDHDTERTLPRRDYGDRQCPNPWCDKPTRVPGEFCRSCRFQQEIQRDMLRASGQRRTA